MSIVKRSIRKILRASGYDILRIDAIQNLSQAQNTVDIFDQGLGVDPYADMKHFLATEESPVVFDVGANIGQSVDSFRNTFTTPTIYSFEPSPSTYETLKAHCKDLPGVSTWNRGVGSTNSTMTLTENEYSVMSSFLPPSTSAWGNVVRSTEVQVVTLDSFASDHGIDFVHILKSDTQGYDFEVFKGANQLMKENRIGLLYFEFIFSDMYKDLPPFDEVFGYLTANNFALVSFYKQYFQHELVSWTDALFINREFYRSATKP